MSLAYFIYIGLLLIMFVFSVYEVRYLIAKNDTNKSLFKRPLAIIPILIYSFIIGLRYDVGIDYLGYKDVYTFIFSFYDKADFNLEFGYLTLLKFLACLRSNFVWLFIIIAFLQISCIYFQSRKNLFLLPFILFFYFTSSNFMYSLNIMRQIIAFNIIFIGVSSIIEKNLYKWIGWCFFAFLFHKTAIICFPFYFLNKEFIKNKYLAVFVLFLLYFLAQYLYQNFLDVFFQNFSLLLDRQVDSQSLISQDRETNVTSGSGLFSLALNLVYIYFLFYYDKCSDYYHKYGFTLYFNIALIGVIIYPIFANNILLDRIVYYFYGFRFIVFAFYAHYFFTVNKNIINTLVMLVFMLLMFSQFMLFINSGSNGISPFQFINTL